MKRTNPYSARYTEGKVGDKVYYCQYRNDRKDKYQVIPCYISEVDDAYDWKVRIPEIPREECGYFYWISNENWGGPGHGVTFGDDIFETFEDAALHCEYLMIREQEALARLDSLKTNR